MAAVALAVILSCREPSRALLELEEGRLDYESWHLDEARQHLERAVALDPELTAAHLTLAHLITLVLSTASDIWLEYEELRSASIDGWWRGIPAMRKR